MIGRLEDPYGVHSYIEFMACSGGHIKVKGDMHNGKACGYEQELTFENEFDQTRLRSFARALFADYAKYAEQKTFCNGQLLTGNIFEKVIREVDLTRHYDIVFSILQGQQ